ncbi:hypothetical protein EK21DRAFT_90760 [Setomelanomma holmii]|uniref:Uncharacterized protein n=1 Tax=Setomelanomma holmii TaxID=210430 RepID=A0A9P4H7G3_9PLEO|nr:hypothetical protein EK21DRAFT_90760 [Setomelanomma holmii]
MTKYNNRPPNPRIDPLWTTQYGFHEAQSRRLSKEAKEAYKAACQRLAVNRNRAQQIHGDGLPPVVNHRFQLKLNDVQDIAGELELAKDHLRRISEEADRLRA